MPGAKILIVDDEHIIRESLKGWLERDGHDVLTAESGEAALPLVEETRFDIIFLDIKMEGMDGIEVLKRIKGIDNDASVVMITAYGSIGTAIEAMKSGAYDYLLKPFEPEQLETLIETIMERRRQDKETLFLREAYREHARFENMLGQSEAMQKVFHLIRDVAPTKATVLITGETGTGKGLAAKAIHSNSPQRDGPFVAVNCGAFTEHLLESELFGHQKGAFTDAKETKRGRLELACGGTLFLDEVGEISMRMQIDLLRVLEDRVFYRVGGTQPIDVDFRVIAATNKDLEVAVREGSFRKDLYYRLKVFSLHIPPLRERKEDIPLLAEHFLRRFAQDMNKAVDQISREALDELMLHEWPGNVRELGNAIERAVVVCKGRKILPKDLPFFRPAPEPSPQDLSLRELERAHIASILAANDWNVSRCAKILGIDRSTLYAKIRRYGLSRSD